MSQLKVAPDVVRLPEAGGVMVRMLRAVVRLSSLLAALQVAVVLTVPLLPTVLAIRSPLQ